jgi:hypothetical protein
MTPEIFKSEALRCGKAITARGRALQIIGDRLSRREKDHP